MRVEEKPLRAYYTLQAKLRGRSLRFLFVLGHMRAGTTLLTNILVGHPSICGFGETHIDYRSKREFMALVRKVCWVCRPGRLRHAYVLDKVLHGRHLPDPALLVRMRVVPVFVIRRPAAAVPSLIERFGYEREAALDYYVARHESLLAEMRLLADAGPIWWTTYHELTARPEAVLQSLATYLGLESPLRGSYELPPESDVVGIGDRSERIRKGRILPEGKPRVAALVEGDLDAPKAAYESSLATLRELGRRPLLDAAAE